MGIARICKQYGGIVIDDKDYVYDYENDKPVLRSTLSDSEKRRIDRAKWERIQKRK